MNAGERVLDFLYTTQLQVDDEWAVTTPTGFIWWAAGNAQSVEILGEQSSGDGMTGYLVGVRTEMVSDLELTDAAAPESVLASVRAAAVEIPGVRVEKLRARKSGQRWYVDMHLHVGPTLSVREAHALAGKVRAHVREHVPEIADVLTHIEPAE